MTPVNAVRGEAEAKIGDMTLRMVVTMDSLARLSEATGRPSLNEMYQRLLGGEVATTRDAIRLFTTGGADGEGKPLKAQPAVSAALLRLSLSDALELQTAFAAMMGALLRTAPTELEEAEVPNE